MSNTRDTLAQAFFPIKIRLTQIKENTCGAQYASFVFTSKEGAMFRLASLLYTLISTSLAGTAIVIVLVAGYGTMTPILAAAAVGFVLAAPLSWALARQLYN